MDDLKLQELIDREAIKELRFNFAQSLDDKNWAAFENLTLDELDTDFTVWGMPPQKVTRQKFIDSFKQNLSRAGLKTQHLYSNFRINLEGDIATVKFNQLAQHYIQGFEGGEEFYLRAEYIDKLVRTEAGWRLSGTKLVTFYTTGNPKILGS